MRFGITEARRSASLFGWDVAREPGAHGDAVIAAHHVDVTNIPTLLLAYSSGATPSEFSLVPKQAAELAGSERRVVLWHHTLEKFGAVQLNARYRAATHSVMTSDAWLGWFSVKLLLESVLRVQTTDATALLAYIQKAEFDGHKGMPLRFDAQRRLRQPLYELTRNARGDWMVARVLNPDGTSAPA